MSLESSMFLLSMIHSVIKLVPIPIPTIPDLMLPYVKIFLCYTDLNFREECITYK